MPRTIPIALQQDLDRGAVTHCVLIRITPVVAGHPPLGLCSTNVNITYDDGTGPLLYRAAVGVELSNASSTSDMAVDNAEATSLLPEFDVPVSEAVLGSGAYDYAAWQAMRVDYLALGKGHIDLGSGELGQVRVVGGTQFIFEPLGKTNKLKQTIVRGSTLRCPARFGSQPLGTPGAAVTEKFCCGFDVTPLWVESVVSGVGIENTRTCTAEDLTQDASFFVPGLLEWTSGANAGRTSEVDEFTEGGGIGLAYETPFPIAEGDTFRIRPDCTKWKDGTNGCRHWWEDAWVLHYRGKPYIPVADINQINVPLIA